MRWQALGLRMPVLLAALALVCLGLLAGDAWAQVNNNNTGGGGNNTGGGGGNIITDQTNDQNGNTVDTVSYSADIQPIFNFNCTAFGCHGANPPSGLELTSYAKFAEGGISGPAFVAGNSNNSLIIKRLEGRIGPRMPLNGVPLGSKQIQNIKDWIDEGGKDN